MGKIDTNKAILVTGAGGYIGQSVVKQALASGHSVKAMLRPGGQVGQALDGAEVLYADLAQDPEALMLALRDVDVVIHTAGSFSANPEQMLRDTLQASQNLSYAMQTAGVSRLVLVGSMAVYDYLNAEKIDESAALETVFSGRDTYCRAKIEQEEVFLNSPDLDVIILRTGAVWGPDRLFNAHLGVALGPVMLRFGHADELPTCHISTCATALVRAAESPTSRGPTIINLLDNERPSAKRYLDAARRCGWPRWVVPVPLALLTGIVRILPQSLRKVGLLRPRTIAARFKPVKFSNKRLHQRLEGVTMVAFQDGMKEAIEKSDRSGA